MITRACVRVSKTATGAPQTSGNTSIGAPQTLRDNAFSWKAVDIPPPRRQRSCPLRVGGESVLKHARLQLEE